MVTNLAIIFPQMITLNSKNFNYKDKMNLYKIKF